jgi:hypothetical protein
MEDPAPSLGVRVCTGLTCMDQGSDADDQGKPADRKASC